MTLILTTVQPTVVVMVSDRRLSHNGTIVDDEATKLTVLVTRDARVCIAYTGIARSGAFQTEEWLLHALRAATNDTLEIYPILEKLRLRASSDIAALNDATNPRLTLAISGFHYDNDDAVPMAWKLTNWEHNENGNAQTEFQLIHYSLTPPNEDFLLCAGNTNAVTSSDMDGIRQLLRDGVAPIGIEAKLHSMVRKASTHENARNTIGRQCNACVIWSNTESTIQTTYYSSQLSRYVYGVNTVFAIGPEFGAMIVAGSVLSVGQSLPPAVVPSAGRNQPCPCGSGQKYRHCHSKISYPYWPFYGMKELNDPPFPPSGRKVSIICTGAAGI
jgi:hypothetical protein